MTEGLAARLAAYQRFGIKLGLDNIQALCAGLGHPETAVPAIHVAGTNGKGSTVAALSAIFAGANYRAGAFTSPHLINVTERIAVEGVPVTEMYLDRVLDTVDEVAAKVLEDDGRATMFEALTAAAFYVFARRQIDVAVYEVGMGGRLDSTNILMPEVSCITTIGLDHTKHLGGTLPEIAGEKAGIIKEGVPLVCGRIDDSALAVVERAAKDLCAPVRRFGQEFGLRSEGELTDAGYQRGVWWGVDHDDVEFDIPLHGGWQLENAACALATAHCLVEDGWNISQKSMCVGLREMQWPGRLEWVSREPAVLFDSAHNPHALRRILPGARAEATGGVLPILAVLDDKDASTMCELLAAESPEVIVTASDQPRALAADALGAVAQPYFKRVEVEPSIAAALARAQAISNGRAVLVVGSIMNYAEARTALQP